MVTAKQMLSSRTAWTAILTVGVAWAGRKLGLTESEQAMLLTGLQALVMGWYLDDKAKGRR